ncbi:MAG TPA: COX15/CtaA family protein [Burkholderiaceae bacterium]|nr:COX15/CtaA family protein [Burkholderiaceae bacterium]
MGSTALINLTPVLKVMLLGLCVAMGPICWWWLKNGHQQLTKRMQTLTLLTLFLTFDLIIFGAFTRLTDSGLGCPDWPGCYGSASPWGAQAQIQAAQSNMPTGPVTHTKAWIEMLHRYLATGVGVLILTLTAFSWWSKYQNKSSKRKPYSIHTPVRNLADFSTVPNLLISPWWPSLSLFWVSLVGAFGALTVTWKLFPAIVTLHLLGAMVLLGLLCKQAAIYTLASSRTFLTSLTIQHRTALWLTFALLWIQIALGGWVSTNYAVLACNTFPTCQNSWWPAMNFESGFTLWRELGLTASGENISFTALTAIHYTHRMVAYLVLSALLGLGWLLKQNKALRSVADWLIGLAVWQLLTGLSNVVLDWPLLAALSHTAGAAALVLVITWLLSTTTVQHTIAFNLKNNQANGPAQHQSGALTDPPL